MANQSAIVNGHKPIYKPLAKKQEHNNRPPPDPEFRKRLRVAMEEAECTPADLIGMEGVSASTVSRWRKGERPDDLRLPQLARRLGVSLKWLKSGEGPRHATPVETGTGQQPSSLKTAAEIDRAMLDLDRARTTLAQLRAALGVTSSEPGEERWIAVAKRAAVEPDTPQQGEVPPGSATG